MFIIFLDMQYHILSDVNLYILKCITEYKSISILLYINKYIVTYFSIF